MNYILTFCFIIILSISTNTDAKKHVLDQINLTINLDEDWVVRSKAHIDALFMNKKTGQVIVIQRQPLISVNSADDLPNNYETLKTYYSENLLASQLEKIAPFFNDKAIFHGQRKFKGLTGPLVELTGTASNIDLTMFIWTAWAGNGAYYISYVSPQKVDADLKSFIKTFKSIAKIDANANPFNQSTKLELDAKNPIINTTFNFQVPSFKSYAPIASKEIDLNEDEDVMSLLLVNMSNGDFIASIPHCFDMNVEQQKFSLESYGTSMLETQFKAQQVMLDGEYHTVLTGNGVDEDIDHMYVQLVMKELNGCYHLLALASSNPFVEFNSLQLAYDHFKETEKLVTPIAYNSHQRTAFSNFFMGTGILAEEENIDPLNFYLAAFNILPDENTLNNVLSYYNTKDKYNDGLKLLSQANAELLAMPAIKSWHAWFYTQTEAYDQAIEAYSELFNKTFTSDEDLFSYIEVLNKKQLWAEAYEAVKKQLPNLNKKSTGLGLLAKYAGFSGMKKETLEAMDLAVADERIDADNIFDIMDGLYEVNETEPLLSLLNKQLKSTPNNLGLWYYKGDVLFGLSQFEEALVAMEKAQEIAPKNERVLEYIEHIKEYLGLGNYQLINQPLTAVTIPQVINNEITQIQPKFAANDAEYLYSVTGLNFKKGEQLRTTYYKKLKINNAKGVKEYKTVTFEYDQDYENVYINEFNVLDKDGNLIQKLDIKTIYITNSEDGLQADDDMVINIPVPQISEGVIIDYTITTQTIAKKSEMPFNRYFFVSPYPSQNRTIYVSGDVMDLEGTTKSTVTRIKDTGLKAWISHEVLAYTYFDFMPDLEDLSNWLIINPIEKEWHTVGLDYLAMINSKINTPISKGQSMAIFSDAKTEYEKIVSAANFIQENINYQALEFGSRALIPNDSKVTLQNKYGDCKDHAVLLHDLLSSQGIKSEIALVETRRKVNSDVPSLDQFNHAVVYLPEIEGGIFIDTTDKDIAIGLNTPPESIQGSTALILSDEKPYLKSVPLMAPAHNKITIDREVSKDESHLIINETIQLTGYLASSFRYSLKNNKSSQVQQIIQSWISDTYSDLELVAFEYYGLSDNQNPLIVEMQSKMVHDNDSLTFPVFFEKNYMDQTRSTNRPVGFHMSQAFTIESATKISPPLVFDTDIVNQGLENFSGLNWQIGIKNGALNFSVESAVHNGTAEEYNKYVDNIKNSIRLLERSVK